MQLIHENRRVKTNTRLQIINRQFYTLFNIFYCSSLFVLLINWYSSRVSYIYIILQLLSVLRVYYHFRIFIAFLCIYIPTAFYKHDVFHRKESIKQRELVHWYFERLVRRNVTTLNIHIRYTAERRFIFSSRADFILRSPFAACKTRPKMAMYLASKTFYRRSLREPAANRNNATANYAPIM